MKIKLFVTFITLFFFSVSCKETNLSTHKIEGKQINIDSTFAAKEEIESFVKPYREHINKQLDSIIAYAPYDLTKNDGVLNSSIGNLMADIVLTYGNKVFTKRTGKNIDMALLNHGGIRAIISKGNITARTAYQVMPFENRIVVAKLSYNQIKELIAYLVKSQRAHPIAGMQLVLNNDNTVKKVTINNKPLQEGNSYYVATSDYLFNGGSNMHFFKPAEEVYELDYLVRNAMIDYFKEVDTLKAKVDNRFIKLTHE